MPPLLFFPGGLRIRYGVIVLFTITRIDDEIVKLRAIMGAVFGILAYVVYKVNLVLFMDASATIWLLAGIVYVASAFYLQYRYGRLGIFHLFFRGILTFYAIWVIEILLLYDLLG